MRRWSGRTVGRFLIVTAVLAMMSLVMLLGGPLYRLGRLMGWAPITTVFITAVCILILFMLYERFLVYLVNVGNYNSRLRARIEVKRYVERQQHRQRKTVTSDGARLEVPIVTGQARRVMPPETRQGRVEVSPVLQRVEEPDINNKPGKVIPFPTTVAVNNLVAEEAKIKRKLFLATEDPAVTENMSLAEVKVLLFNLGGCEMKAKDCGDTVLLRLAWADEKGRERFGEWRLDKNSPDYLWAIEQTNAADIEAAEELLNLPTSAVEV